MSNSICWFRRDLRLDDNPAWSAATAGTGVLPLFVLEPALLRSAGPLRRRQLLANVAALEAELRSIGAELHIAEGPATAVVAPLAEAVGAGTVHVNADVSPFSARRDAAVAARTSITSHWGTLVHPPGSVLTGKGTLSRVFTPFYKRWIDQPVAPVAAPGAAEPRSHPASSSLPSGVASPPFTAGAAGAHERLRAFLETVDDYPELRDIPAVPGTSMLSADLKFGTIGPREVLDIVGTATPGRSAFVRQLAWRDWHAHMLHGQPRIAREAVRPEYDRIAWLDEPADLEAWRQGRTGYPVVDAGMRQLLATGWMHNRVRMIAGSFLVKDLLIDWRQGERWFRRLLIDGDVAQNVGNWQWVAGTGNDAAPYFRIFNPVSQSKKFDPDGAYIKHWVPELAGLDMSSIHAPWEVGPLELATAGVVLDDTYPAPIVDHAMARERCLATYKAALDR